MCLCGVFSCVSMQKKSETAQTNKDASGLGTFYYTVPSGFKALHTKNVTIESSTVYNAKKHFETF